MRRLDEWKREAKDIYHPPININYTKYLGELIPGFNERILALIARIEKLEEALKFYATAPCHPGIIKIAPNFRETAQEALAEDSLEVNAEKN